MTTSIIHTAPPQHYIDSPRPCKAVLPKHDSSTTSSCATSQVSQAEARPASPLAFPLLSLACIKLVFACLVPCLEVLAGHTPQFAAAAALLVGGSGGLSAVGGGEAELCLRSPDEHTENATTLRQWRGHQQQRAATQVCAAATGPAGQEFAARYGAMVRAGPHGAALHAEGVVRAR